MKQMKKKRMYNCLFLDAAEYVEASKTDGCHLDAENQKKLGKVIAEFVGRNE